MTRNVNVKHCLLKPGKSAPHDIEALKDCVVVGHEFGVGSYQLLCISQLVLVLVGMCNKPRVIFYYFYLELVCNNSRKYCNLCSLKLRCLLFCSSQCCSCSWSRLEPVQKKYKDEKDFFCVKLQLENLLFTLNSHIAAL